MKNSKILYWSMYPIVASQLALGSVILTGLAFIVQHNSGNLSKKVAKFCSHNPEGFINKMKKRHITLYFFIKIFFVIY